VDFGAALVMAGLYNTPATKKTMKSSAALSHALLRLP
jgi:hypothetical protein